MAARNRILQKAIETISMKGSLDDGTIAVISTKIAQAMTHRHQKKLEGKY